MSGTIVTNGTFTNVQRLMDESDDVVRLIGNNEISFAFHNYGGLDGLGFTSTCGSHVTMENFELNGKAAPFDEIDLGSPTTHATSNPETFARSTDALVERGARGRSGCPRARSWCRLVGSDCPRGQNRRRRPYTFRLTGLR